MLFKIMSKKYIGVREGDTKWDDYHRKNGMMTNHEFFSSNEKGGFYEGMSWDDEDEEWISDTPEKKITTCADCGGDAMFCWC